MSTPKQGQTPNMALRTGESSPAGPAFRRKCRQTAQRSPGAQIAWIILVNFFRLNMRDLPHVTLACVDTANHDLALRALALSSARLRFGRTVFFTDTLPTGTAPPEGLEISRIAPIRSRDAYSQFVLKDLVRHIATSHVLLVQWDGYVANPAAWEDAFLEVDYIGALWASFTDGMRVGNGGFSLRSRKLLEALADPTVVLHDAEDLTIGRTFRPWLEQSHGIRFADNAMADRFAFEAAYPIGKPFGFHGLFNFCRTVAPAELAQLAAGFSDAIACSQQCRALLRNCLALAQWQPAMALARRILAAEPADGEAAAAMGRAQASSVRGVGVGRNDPCPCGSGKRYKQCHGAAATISGAAVTTEHAAATPTTDQAAVATGHTTPTGTPNHTVERGIQAHRANDLDAAERCYRDALAMAPDHPFALHYLGVVLYQRSRVIEAMPLLDRAVALLPREPEFHNNRAQALAVMQRHAEAKDAYARALELNPDHALAWNNLGLTLQAMGDVIGAVNAYRKALERLPEFAQCHWNLALALLLQGNYAQGFAEYEWRLRAPEFSAALPLVAGSRWDGTDPAGKTLLLTVEQGLGDTIQNLRFAEVLAARGARIIVATPRSLCNLAATAPGIAQAIPDSELLPPYDAHVSVMSLPAMLGVTAASIHAVAPYIAAQVDRVSATRQNVERAAGRALKIGIAWTGATGNAYNLRRSCPLAMFADLFATTDVRWFSLHREIDAVAADDAARAGNLIRLPERNDLDGTAALVTALDLVISVDTSLAHLAGALGKPVWVLLPFAPDWRWLEHGTTTPWYPTATLFRQKVAGDWSDPIAEIAAALQRLLTHR